MEKYLNHGELEKLLKENGVLTPSHGFTQNLMQLIETEKIEPVRVYKPLLSRKTWGSIVSAMIMLFVCCWWLLISSNTKGEVKPGILDRVTGYLKNIDLSVHLSTDTLFIATIAVACLGTLLVLDIWFSHRKHNVIV